MTATHSRTSGRPSRTRAVSARWVAGTLAHRVAEIGHSVSTRATSQRSAMSRSAISRPSRRRTVGALSPTARPMSTALPRPSRDTSVISARSCASSGAAAPCGASAVRSASRCRASRARSRQRLPSP
ncbi:hypothetical protein CCS38_25910 [Streptomyces purpurogeneiscleroticus]|nr:hypothetical protein [Streptomyces purpurogeneiscleroticus]